MIGPPRNSRAKNTSDSLAERYSRFLKRQGNEWCVQCSTACLERRRTLRELAQRGIVTIADLLVRFSGLSSRLKLSAIDLIRILRIRQAVPVLLAALPDRSVRLMCADGIRSLKPGRKTTRIFLEIGRRELQSPRPDRDCLEAVVYALGTSDDPRGADLLVSIFERRDLPGRLRGDAGDKLGVNARVKDRRTALYRRCRDAALRGLWDDSINVLFGSMYVIGSLCNVRGSRRTIDSACKSALPRLREIAANDDRLSPGFWWPMSAEAEDTICSIENGIWPDPDAAERWQMNTERRKISDE